MKSEGKFNTFPDTSRISPTALHTAYIWYKNGLSHPVFYTPEGRRMYRLLRPGILFSRYVLGVSDLETRMVQRHVVIDRVLEASITENGLRQIIETGAGLSSRGVRFVKKFADQGIFYVETDLPAMAQKKRSLLSSAGLLIKNYEVSVANILAENGDLSLRSVAEKFFDKNLALAIVTEGVICYFDKKTMEAFWARTARLLKDFKGGTYVTDAFINRTSRRLGLLFGLWFAFLARYTHGKVYTHFGSDQDVEKTFLDAGFSRVRIHRPEDYPGAFPLPLSRKPGFISVVEAII